MGFRCRFTVDSVQNKFPIRYTLCLRLRCSRRLDRHALLRLVHAEYSPNRRIALEAAAECDLQGFLAPAHVPKAFEPFHLVPDRRGRSVPPVVQRLPRGLHVLVGQPQVLLDAVDDGSPTSMYAEMVHCCCEIWYVWRRRLHVSDACRIRTLRQ